MSWKILRKQSQRIVNAEEVTIIPDATRHNIDGESCITIQIKENSKVYAAKEIENGSFLLLAKDDEYFDNKGRRMRNKHK